MPRDSSYERLERLMVGDRDSAYRQFVVAMTVVTAALVLAYLLTSFGVLGLDPALASLFGTAAGVAIAAYVTVGIVQFVVLARAYEEGATEVADTAAKLEAAAEEVVETADELDESVETVETAAERVDEAAEVVDEAAADRAAGPSSDEATTRVEGAAERVDEAVERAGEAREEVDAARETADAVKETAEREKERLPDADESGE